MDRFNYVEFSQYQRHFLKKIKMQGKTNNTINNYKTDFRTFSQYTKEKDIRSAIFDFSVNHALDYKYYLEKKYGSTNTRRRKLQSMRIFYDYIVERKKLPDNPFKPIVTSPKVLNFPEPTIQKDLKKLWTEFEKEEQSSSPISIITAKRNRCIFLLIVGCNLKPSEIAVLDQSHIIFTDRGSRIMILGDREPYSIPIPDVAIEYLKDYIEYYNKVVPKNNRRMFFGSNATTILQQKIQERGVQKIFQRYSKNLNISCTPKTLRQSCILRWVNNNLPESMIKEYMGVAPIYDMTNYIDAKDRWNLELKFIA